jgi:hypothetical protein
VSLARDQGQHPAELVAEATLSLWKRIVREGVSDRVVWGKNMLPARGDMVERRSSANLMNQALASRLRGVALREGHDCRFGVRLELNTALPERRPPKAKGDENSE